MARLDRIREAKKQIQREAVERWQQRTPEREQQKAKVAAGGEGAADSPQRNARYQARQQGIERARELSRAGVLPRSLERKMGATLDYVPFAPSEAARKAGRPVARIVQFAGAGTLPEGFATGFLVGERLLLTNHHVFPSAADAVEVAANFLFERSDRGILAGQLFELAPDEFFVSDQGLDFALVAVKPRAQDGTLLADLGVVSLIEATPKILIGQPVNIIQYPGGQEKQYAVKNNRLVDLMAEGFMHYETDTQEGSSGSPAFSRDWELVGLHHASIPEMREGRVVAVNGRNWYPEMGDDEVHWIANEGTRVSAIVGALGKIQLHDAKQQAILDQLLASTTDPVDDLAQQGATGVSGTEALKGVAMPSGGTAMGNNQFYFSGPVTIHVYAAAAPAPVAPSIPIPPAVAPTPLVPEAAIRFDPDYEHREGYDPAFLGRGGNLLVPTPTIHADRLAEIMKDQQGAVRVLKYHHFELVMNEQRRIQMWSAVNVDYDPAKKAQGDRDSFGRDKWVPDPRIPAVAQIFDADFYKPAGNIDRGHVVRREDNAWGNTPLEIEYANSDTFHWTNCTPQHEAFNQSSPGQNDPQYRGMSGLWGAFENHVQRSRRGHDTKMCILAGPVLDNVHDPSKDFGRGPVQYPLRFWKVVCIADPDEHGAQRLQVYGFLLSQEDVVQRFGIERFDPGRFADYRRSLDAITEATGVVFPRVLHDAEA